MRRVNILKKPIVKSLGLDAFCDSRMQDISEIATPCISINAPQNKECFKIDNNKMNEMEREISDTMDQIFPELWLGKIIDEKKIVENQFTHVISVITEKELMEITGKSALSFEKTVITKWIKNIVDDGNSEIEKYLDECSNFINNAIINNGKVYVHCKYGRSRSVTIVSAYIMKYGLGNHKILRKNEFCNFGNFVCADIAMNYVAQHRPNACQRLGFRIALENYEKQLLIKKSFDNINMSNI